jgi:hypothetical protein
MRLRREHAFQEVLLEPRQHGGHEDDDADPDGDAAEDEESLEAALAQKAQGGDPFEGKKALHGGTALSRWPLKTPELVGTTRSPSLAPSRISTKPLPRSPMRTG